MKNNMISSAFFFSSWTTKIRSIAYVVYQRRAVKRKPEHSSQPLSLWQFLYFFSKGEKITDISCRPCQNRHLFSISCTYPFLRAYCELRRSSGHRSGLCIEFLIRRINLALRSLLSPSLIVHPLSLLSTRGLWICPTQEEVCLKRRQGVRWH